MNEQGLKPINKDIVNLVEDGFLLLMIGHCPKCEYEELNEINNYCSNCGQKLDWK